MSWEELQREVRKKAACIAKGHLWVPAAHPQPRKEEHVVCLRCGQEWRP